MKEGNSPSERSSISGARPVAERSAFDGLTGFSEAMRVATQGVNLDGLTKVSEVARLITERRDFAGLTGVSEVARLIGKGPDLAGLNKASEIARLITERPDFARLTGASEAARLAVWGPALDDMGRMTERIRRAIQGPAFGDLRRAAERTRLATNGAAFSDLLSVSSALQSMVRSQEFLAASRVPLGVVPPPATWPTPGEAWAQATVYTGLEVAVERGEPAEAVPAAERARRVSGIAGSLVVRSSGFTTLALLTKLLGESVEGQPPSDNLVIVLVASLLIYFACGGKLPSDPR